MKEKEDHRRKLIFKIFMYIQAEEKTRIHLHDIYAGADIVSGKDKATCRRVVHRLCATGHLYQAYPNTRSALYDIMDKSFIYSEGSLGYGGKYLSTLHPSIRKQVSRHEPDKIHIPSFSLAKICDHPLFPIGVLICWLLVSIIISFVAK